MAKCDASSVGLQGHKGKGFVQLFQAQECLGWVCRLCDQALGSRDDGNPDEVVVEEDEATFVLMLQHAEHIHGITTWHSSHRDCDTSMMQLRHPRSLVAEEDEAEDEADAAAATAASDEPWLPLAAHDRDDVLHTHAALFEGRTLMDQVRQHMEARLAWIARQRDDVTEARMRWEQAERVPAPVSRTSVPWLDTDPTSDAGTEGEAGPIVKLDVGGQLFHVRLAVLRKVPSVLCELVSGRVTVYPGVRDQRLFLDRDGTAFRHLITLLEGKPLPRTLKAWQLHALRGEAEFYELDALLATIDDHCTHSNSGGGGGGGGGGGSSSTRTGSQLPPLLLSVPSSSSCAASVRSPPCLWSPNQSQSPLLLSPRSVGPRLSSDGIAWRAGGDVSRSSGAASSVYRGIHPHVPTAAWNASPLQQLLVRFERDCDEAEHRIRLAATRLRRQREALARIRDKIATIHTDMRHVVRLSVQGQAFHTQVSTLCTRSGYLATKFAALLESGGGGGGKGKQFTDDSKGAEECGSGSGGSGGEVGGNDGGSDGCGGHVDVHAGAARVQADDQYYLDRDPMAFAIVLAYLRGQRHMMRDLTDTEMSVLRDEAAFYGLPELVSHVYLPWSNAAAGDVFEPGPDYAVSQGGRRVTATGSNRWRTAVGRLVADGGRVRWNVRILKKTGGVYVGIVPPLIPRSSRLYKACGFFMYAYNGTLCSGPPHSYRHKAYGSGDLKPGDVIGVEWNGFDHTLAFYVNGRASGIAYRSLPTDQSFRLAVNWFWKGVGVELMQ